MSSGGCGHCGFGHSYTGQQLWKYFFIHLHEVNEDITQYPLVPSLQRLGIRHCRKLNCNTNNEYMYVHTDT